MSVFKLLLGETIGSFLLIFIANGLMYIVNIFTVKKSLVLKSLFWGFAVFIASYIATLIGNSGDINPAVTTGNFIKNFHNYFIFLEINNFLLYFSILFFQIFGAIIGQIIINLILYKPIKSNLNNELETKNIISSHVPIISTKNKTLAYFCEFISTTILIAVILLFPKMQSSVNLPILNNLIVMFLVIIGVYFIGPITGFSINPIRDLCPKIVYFFNFKNYKQNINWNDSLICTLTPFAASIVTGSLFLI